MLFALWRHLNGSATIDQHVRVFQRHRPYCESEHVLAHVLNLFSAGTCIEDRATVEHDQAMLRMFSTRRFAELTTSSDFLTRFEDDTNPQWLCGLRAAVDNVQDEPWNMLRKRRRRRGKLERWCLVDVDAYMTPELLTWSAGIQAGRAFQG